VSSIDHPGKQTPDLFCIPSPKKSSFWASGYNPHCHSKQVRLSGERNVSDHDLVDVFHKLIPSEWRPRGFGTPSSFSITTTPASSCTFFRATRRASYAWSRAQLGFHLGISRWKRETAVMIHTPGGRRPSARKRVHAKPPKISGYPVWLAHFTIKPLPPCSCRTPETACT